MGESCSIELQRSAPAGLPRSNEASLTACKLRHLDLRIRQRALQRRNGLATRCWLGVVPSSCGVPPRIAARTAASLTACELLRHLDLRIQIRILVKT